MRTKYLDNIVDPGMMNYSCTIRNYTTARGDNGEEQVTFANWETVWGKLEDIKAWENLVSDQEMNINDRRLTIYYLTGLDEKMEIVIDSITYDITGLTYDAMKRYHFLTIRQRK